MADDRIEIRLPKDADVTIRVEPGGRPTVQSPYVDSEPTPTKYSDDVEDFLRTFDPETASPEDIERAESISKEMAAQMFTSDPTRDGIDFVPSRLIDGHPVLDVGHVTPDANLDAVRNLVASLARSRPDTTLRIVEVGPWLGATTIALTQGFGPAGGFVFAIDSWKGTPHGYLSDVVEAMGGTEGVYNAFRQNINTLYNTVVKPVNTISLNAIATLDIGQVDMVFYDGSYVPTEIVDNLRGWMKLVAPDGV
ncbi:MAG: class I SAM-dependent methyltransferase, partial [Bdellovibrionales bacterium]|nr:class I SAM-dependent methyltransferase [Bdellovibrionales bacterium]